MKLKISNLIVAAVCGLFTLVNSTLAQGTAFTYQGQLQSGAEPANGTYSLTFTLFASSAGVSTVAGPLTNNGVGVSNGLFTATLDFGSGAWNGQTNWLEIAVETNGGSGFATLTPRQRLTPVPYAIFANTANNLNGMIPPAQLPATVVTNDESGVTLGSLSVISNVNLPAVATIYAGGASLLHADAAFNFFAGQDAGNLKMRGSNNVAVGDEALQFCTNDNQEVAVGFQTLQYDDGTNAGGWLTVSGNGENAALGYQALKWNTNGFANTAVGYQSLCLNTSGEASTALGDGTLFYNTSGLCNTAVGYQTMYNNTTGSENTAIGLQTLYSSTTGWANTAAGWGAMCYAETGSFNAAYGYNALEFCTNDSDEVAVGLGALENDNACNRGTASGDGENTAVGYLSLASDFFGTANSALGYNSLSQIVNGDNNTAVGDGALFALASGSNNIALGSQAGLSLTAASNNIDIGNPGVAGDNNIIRLGAQGVQTACYLAGTVYANGTFVSSSDRNAKENFKAIDARVVLEKVAALPISRWNYKQDAKSAHIGPMAQDFYSAFDVGPDDKHITTVDEGGVALAAIQGLNQKLEEKDAQITQLRQSIAELKAMVSQLAANKTK